VHARHGQRLDETDWRRIETLRGFVPTLELLRAGPLRPWLVGVGEHTDSHRIELLLRRHWRATVEEVAAWLPAAWQPAVRWCAWLPELAALQHLARGGEPPRWMRDDEVWRDACALPPAEREAWLASGSAAALAPGWRAPDAVGELWLAAWRRRLPALGGGDRAGLDALARQLHDHRHEFGRAALGQGAALRAQLQSRLVAILRRLAPQPAVVFVHLALAALDLERLRAELLRRLLFPRWGAV
jgi:hypothetical protein